MGEMAQNTACWAFTAARMANRISTLAKKTPTNKIKCHFWYDVAVAKLKRMLENWKGKKSVMLSTVGGQEQTADDQTVAAEVGWKQSSHYGYPCGLLTTTIKHENYQDKPLFGIRTKYTDGKFEMKGACLKFRLIKRSFKDKAFFLKFAKE